MDRLHTTEAYVIDFVKEAQLPGEIPDCPLSLEARRLILAECPVVISMPNVEQDSDINQLAIPFSNPRAISGYDPASFSLKQPTYAHNRSYELLGDWQGTPWIDEFGNTYNSITLKGCNFANPGVMEHPTAVDQYVAWGLQESKIISRVLASSEVMRARGISTEYIVGLAEPASYPWPLTGTSGEAYENISLSEYRIRIVQQYWMKLPDKQRTFTNLADITKKFQEMTFFVSMRATDTAYRLGDMKSQPLVARPKVYEYVNKFKLSDNEEAFSVESSDDWQRYLRNHMVPNLAKNLARLHIDLAHGFMHGLNITALGGIVDTDSVHGESLGLGDEPATFREKADDLLQAANELHSAALITIEDDERRSILEEFIGIYMEQTLKVAPSVQEAREQLSEIVSCVPSILEVNDKYYLDFEDNRDFLEKMISKKYLEILIVADDTETYASFVAAAENQMRSELESPVMSEAVQQFMSMRVGDYADDIVSEYINELNDPTFDISAVAVSKNLSRAMREETTMLLVDAAKPEAIEMIKKLITSFYKGSINGVVRDTLASAYFNEIVPLISRHLEAYAQKTFRDIDPDITSLSLYERPTSIIPDQSSRPFVGVRDRFLWVGTEFVDFENFIDAVHQLPYEVTVNKVSKPKKGTNITLDISDGSELIEIISDGMVVNSSYIKSSKEMTIQIDDDEADSTYPKYAAVVLTKGDTKKIELFLVDEYADELNQKLGLELSGLQREPDQYLF